MKLNIEIIFVYNILRILGWIQVIIFLMYQTSLELTEITTISNLVRILTVAKLFEIIFIKPQEIFDQRNLVKYYQYLTRILVLYFLMFPGLCFCSFRNAISGWAVQEVLESLYHLSKSEQIKSIKNYISSFLIPFTTLGIIRILNRVVEKYDDEIEIYRIIQILIILLSIHQIYINIITHNKQKFYKLKMQKKT
ncbi:unnamed protein product [Paramecium sonneborni]|uniref:Uncharacterized protein n=1 Tax=Paramecium sonneborni TaxID=65129 RepID=A0A8S1NR83_9CILI|nr:unnamed protein product [Paramecium sonneborni]